MSKVDDVLRIARGEIGYYRHNDPQTGTKYGRWMAQKTGQAWYGANGVAYCAMFVSWVFDHAGQSCLGLPSSYCPSILAAAASRIVSTRRARPGDIVLFDWNRDRAPDHIGIVEKNDGSYITTIEGNTSRGDGSQSNGGWVARRTRSWSVVRAVIRPPYADMTVPAPSKPIAQGGRLATDGYWGPATQVALQKHYGTPVDGVMSHQLDDGVKPGLRCAEYDKTRKGSLLVSAMQKQLGVETDGLLGPATIKALQKHYGTPVDGVLSAPSQCVSKMQETLNAGKF